MKKLLCSVAITFGIIFSTAGFAQSGTFGIDYLVISSTVKQSDIAYKQDFNITAIQFRGSFPVDPMIDIEGTIAVGINDDTATQTYFFPPDVLDLQATVELSQAIGVFAKFHTDPSLGYQVYGKLGLQQVSVKAKEIDLVNGLVFDALNHSGNDSGLAYGFGASFNLSGNGSLVAEYMVFPTVDVDGADADSTSISIGFQMPF